MTHEMQRGKITLSAVFWTLVFLAAIYLSVKLIPVYVNNFQLQDAMQNEARLAVLSRRTPEQVRDSIFAKAQELELPLRRDQIRVEGDIRSIRILCEYDVVVELPGKTLTLHFNPSSAERSLF